MKKPKNIVYEHKGVSIVWSALCGGTWIVVDKKMPRYCTIKEARAHIDSLSKK